MISDILFCALDFLPSIIDLSSCSCVCKQWKACIDRKNGLLWKKFIAPFPLCNVPNHKENTKLQTLFGKHIRGEPDTWLTSAMCIENNRSKKICFYCKHYIRSCWYGRIDSTSKGQQFGSWIHYGCYLRSIDAQHIGNDPSDWTRPEFLAVLFDICLWFYKGKKPEETPPILGVRVCETKACRLRMKRMVKQNGTDIFYW
jgi:hypothetical protein